ncbi:MAG: methionyl-tRNA formyltransferase [Christensenellaceae bacterium]|jgi:methionyl-tRNA formyltransferase|nr:methionyl-tRNA formyltransferase [Christensenellaceae bacterium]
MKIVFMGSPDLSVVALQALLKSRHEVVCVITQPDRPAGRGGAIYSTPLKQFAEKVGLPILQPERVSNDISGFMKFEPDIIVTAAFGQMLKQNVLEACKFGVINVHASLLPKYRGSSPVQWAIINGETQTGVTIMQTDIGLDTGDIILQKPLDIEPEETSGELLKRLAFLGADALIEALDLIESGRAKHFPQKETEATYFELLKKETGRINWSLPSYQIVNIVRGLNPWPVAYFNFKGETFRVHKATAIPDEQIQTTSYLDTVGRRIGEVVYSSAKVGLFVKCLDGVLRIDKIQPAGKPVMAIRDFLNGRQISEGATLG